MMDLDTLQRTSYEVAESKGFHQAQAEMDPETAALYLRLLLTIGELSEAAEELRSGHGPLHVYYEFIDEVDEHTTQTTRSDFQFRIQTTNGTWFLDDYEAARHVADDGMLTVGKPAGFPIEIADAQIRLADLAEGVQRIAGNPLLISAACEVKEAFNRTRAFLHGKTA